MILSIFLTGASCTTIDKQKDNHDDDEFSNDDDDNEDEFSSGPWTKRLVPQNNKSVTVSTKQTEHKRSNQQKHSSTTKLDGQHLKFIVQNLSSPILWILMISFSIGTLVFSVLMKYTPPLAIKHGIQNDQVTFILSMSGIPDLCTRLICGLICDSVIIRRHFKRYRRFGVSLVLMSVVCAWLPFMQTYTELMVIMCCVGASTGMYRSG